MKKIILAAFISTSLVFTSVAPAFAEEVQSTQPTAVEQTQPQVHPEVTQTTQPAADQTTVNNTTTTSVNTTATDNTVVVPDIKPDSPLYFLKGIFEKVQLFLTFNEVEKAKLLEAIATERLEDLKQLDPAKQQESIEKISNVYAETIKKLSEIAATQKAEGKEAMEVNAILEKAADKAVEVESKEEVKQEIKDIINRAIVKNVDPKVVEQLRNKGFGYGKIALVAAIAEKSGKTVDEVVKVLEVQKGIGKTAKELGLKPGQFKKIEKEVKHNTKEVVKQAKIAVEEEKEEIEIKGEEVKKKENHKEYKKHEKKENNNKKDRHEDEDED